MATRRITKAAEPNFWEENRSLISSGIVILILIALAFLAIDTLTRSKNNDQSKANSTKQTTDTSNDSNKTSSTNSNSSNSQNKNQTTTAPTKYTVAAGDSLWTLAEKYYHDGFKWTAIAAKNPQIANPDVLYIGASLDIPKLEVAAAPSTNLPTNYTVAAGDTLWDLANKYYGDPYQWFRIRDANKNKVGLLPNGRPLISPGSVLTIPKI